MMEPIFQSYKNVYDIAQAIISRKMSLREGYDIILLRKLDLLHRAGYERRFDIEEPADRALTRLFCLGNTTCARNADVIFTAFTKQITDEARQKLVYGLNVDGSIEEPAVQATYTPAMLRKAAGNTVSDSQEEKINAIAAMLRYLARCMVVELSSLEKLRKGVTVIERDIRKIISVLDSKEFKLNPDVLDQEDIPEDQVANLAPGY
jgi:hypothetical protein